MTDSMGPGKLNWSVICKIRRIHMTNTDMHRTGTKHIIRHMQIHRSVVRHIKVHLY